MKSPLKWVGGKFYQTNMVIGMFPQHKCYVEVFGGAGHVLFTKTPSPVEVYNDLNSELVNFFMVARDHTEELMQRVDTLPYSRELLQKWANEPLPEDKIERACRWFYILCSSFGGIYGSGWAYSVQGNNAVSLRSSTERIKDVKARFNNVMIENVSYESCIQKYDRVDTLFFIDPPYMGQTSKEFYYNKSHNKIPVFTEQDHILLAGILNNIKGKAIVSYFPTELLKELYPDSRWNWHYSTKTISNSKAIKADNSIGSLVREEVFLTNFTKQSLLFDYFMKGGDEK
ncbi:DNA adenine methylase [Patescibacteria group bacterium]|nr:DNA adenine methylase [Patescibacteria group bacterium]